MNPRTASVEASRPGVWVVAFLLLAPLTVAAGEKGARVDSVAGVLLARQGGTWKALQAMDAWLPGTALVAMPKAEISSANGAVQVILLADVAKRSPLPVLEAGATLHAATDVDLDISLDRGMLVVVNQKKEGEAKIRLRVTGEPWVVTLHDPGTKVAFEIYGRLPPGLPEELTKPEAPMTEVIGLITAGEAFVDMGQRGIGMRAPPGLAWLHWDNIHRKASVRRLDKLPESLVKPLDGAEEKLFTEMCVIAKGLAKDEVGAGLKRLTKSEDRVARLVGVTLAGALDEIPTLVEVLDASKHAEARDHAILVMRHWLGREPGQVAKVYAKMTQEKKMTEVQARSTLHLLLGFDEQEKGRPETYDLLIHCLAHSRQGVRELARWHLVRLAPAGKDIPYDAAAPEPDRVRAQQMWRKLIPEGELPPEPAAEPKVEKKGT